MQKELPCPSNTLNTLGMIQMQIAKLDFPRGLCESARLF